MKGAGVILILTLLLVNTIPLSAQTAIRHQVVPVVAPDSADIAYYSKKNWRHAGAQVFTINMGVWAFDRYIQNAEFARVDGHTIRENFRKGFLWDNDQMGTNMFLHPYHGSLYYNSARANGLNYWESGMFAAGGSLMWELFMENEYPSTNDVIATPIGGMVLGEVFHRTSDLIRDDRKTGQNRIWREVAAGIINPGNALVRLVNGDAYKKRATSGRQHGIPDLAVEISAGVRALEFEDPVIDKGIGAAVNINIDYGDRFNDGGEKPYDYFTFKTNLSIQASQPVLSQLNILGRLWVTELLNTKRDFINIGIYQHFDFYDSDTISAISHKIPYKFCTPASFGVGLMHKSSFSRHWILDSYAHLNGIILGGALSDYYNVYNRDYNLASGFSFKLGFNIGYKKLISLSANYETYKMFTWQGYAKDASVEEIDRRTGNYQGDHSQAMLHAVNSRLDLRLKDRLYLTGIVYTYSRDTNYRYHDDVYSLTSEGRLMLTYKF